MNAVSLLSIYRPRSFQPQIPKDPRNAAGSRVRVWEDMGSVKRGPITGSGGQGAKPPEAERFLYKNGANLS